MGYGKGEGGAGVDGDTGRSRLLKREREQCGRKERGGGGVVVANGHTEL